MTLVTVSWARSASAPVVRELRQFRGAPHERRVRQQRRRLIGSIEDFTGRDRCREALQFERTTIAQRECRLPGEQACHQPAAQDLLSRSCAVWVIEIFAPR
jgi:hypothetical protein